MTGDVFFATARRSFHKALLASVLSVDSKGIPSNADSYSAMSVRIATGILERLGAGAASGRLAGQSAGSQFEEICKEYLELTFPRLAHLRPWPLGSQQECWRERGNRTIRPVRALGCFGCRRQGQPSIGRCPWKRLSHQARCCGHPIPRGRQNHQRRRPPRGQHAGSPHSLAAGQQQTSDSSCQRVV